MRLPRLLTAAEYAEKWGYSRATVINWCRSGKIDECQFVGNRMWVIAASAVRANKFLPKRELGLLNELSDVNPLTGQPKKEYPAPPEPTGLKGYVLPNLQLLRLGQGLSKKELSELSGVDRQVIRRAERGRGIHAHNVRGLAYGLGVGVGELIREGYDQFS